MDKKSGLKRLKSKSGESLLYVFIIMTFLTIISVSITVATSSNFGFALRQKEYSEIMLLDESVHKNIMYSLQADSVGSDGLGQQLAYALYEGNEALGDIHLNISFSDGFNIYSDGIKVESVLLSFPEQNLFIRPSAPAVYTSEQIVEIVYNGSEEIETARTIYTLTTLRMPKTIDIIAVMEVTVRINANGKIHTSKATYDYFGGKLSDEPYYDKDPFDEVNFHDLDNPHSLDNIDRSFPMNFTADGYGTWRLTNYENMDAA